MGSGGNLCLDCNLDPTSYLKAPTGFFGAPFPLLTDPQRLAAVVRTRHFLVPICQSILKASRSPDLLSSVISPWQGALGSRADANKIVQVK